MAEPFIQFSQGVCCRLEFECTLVDARAATLALKRFLAGQQLTEKDLFACELCLAEACNNAVQYCGEVGKHKTVVVEINCTASQLEFRVTDHTPGFDWPKEMPKPSLTQEHGRGIFLIKSLMTQADYFRGDGTNVLVLRKNREAPLPISNPAKAGNLEAAQKKLAEQEQTITEITRELCFRSESLTAIFRCCAELGRTSDLEGFSRRLLGDLLYLCGADWFVLRITRPGDARLVPFAASHPELRTQELILPVPGQSPTALELKAAVARRLIAFDGKRAQISSDPLLAAGANANGVVHPLLFGDSIVGTLAIGRTESTASFSDLQIEVIRTFSEFLAIQLVSARHVEAEVNARLNAHELEIARNIQRALLPRTLPQPPNFALAGSCESARRVGGDFYDAIPISDSSLLLVVADVMGKGIPAAMFATITRSLIRALAAQTPRPSHLLQRLNALLYEELSAVGMFVTAQLVFIDFSTRDLVTASAGHCPVLLAQPSLGKCYTVRTTGTPLGIIPNAQYRQEMVSLEDPCGLLLYTDGLTEARNPAGEMFGEARLIDWFKTEWKPGRAADDMREKLVSDLHAFRGGGAPQDDEAFLLLIEESFAAPKVLTQAVAPSISGQLATAEM